MERSSFSIIVPAYNAENFIEEALRSCAVAATSSTAIQADVIVVNNGSTDDTSKVIDKVANEYPKIFTVHNLEKNLTPTSAVNIGAKISRSEYLTFCDADDILHERTLIEFANVLTNSSFVVAEREGFKVESGQKIATYTMATSKRHLLLNAVEDGVNGYLLRANLASLPIAVSAERFHQVGGYNETMHVAYDYDLPLKLVYTDSGIVPPAYLNKPLYQYRETPTSHSKLSRDDQLIEMKAAIESALHRLGIFNLQAVHRGRDATGYIYFDHVPKVDRTSE